MDAREERGREIAKSKKIERTGKRYKVPSQSGSAVYFVDFEAAKCSCPDFELRGARCKHWHAVAFAIVWETQIDSDGNTTETLTVKKRTYAQPDWSAYHRSQVEEKDRVEALLSALCDGIVEPAYVFGRPGHLLRDEVFAVAHKVYTGASARRAQTDLRRCHERGYLSRVPAYNSVIRATENAALTPVLKALINESASVLAEFESHFAADSTGFMTVTYARYYDFKYGKGRRKADHAAKGEVLPPPREQRDSIKLHAMVGAVTNVVTHAEVTQAGDSPTLPALIDGTAPNFTMKEVSADKAYLSKANVEAITAVGARPLIPFKENSSGKGPLLWRKMYAEFMLNRPEFLQRYHGRSNVESTFSMIKRVLGGFVRSKLPVAQENEVYAKVLVHNLRCVVEATFFLGLEPVFKTIDPKVALPASEVGGL